jgi:hypothetical protein
MGNEIDFNVFFSYVVVLQWTIVNRIRMFIVSDFIIMLLNIIGVIILLFYYINMLDR